MEESKEKSTGNSTGTRTAGKVTNVAWQIFVFNCKRCGHCCTDLTGITVLPEDVERIAYHLGLSRNQFKERYTYTKGGMRFMAHPCPFYKDGCSIYVARPKVCHLYPLQVQNGRYGAATGCPGAAMIPLGGEKVG